MENENKMQYCDACDVYVGESDDGRLVVVVGDAFRACLRHYVRAQDLHVVEVYEPIAWVEDAVNRSPVAWFEPDESRKSWKWYRARGQEELHDHSLWLESLNVGGVIWSK